MKQSQFLTLATSQTGAVITLALIATAAIFYSRQKAKVVVDAALNPIFSTFFNSELYQGASVELTPFSLIRLRREYFSESWIMLSEPYSVFNSGYPEELANVLTGDRVLKEEFRGLINYE